MIPPAIKSAFRRYLHRTRLALIDYLTDVQNEWPINHKYLIEVELRLREIDTKIANTNHWDA